MDQDLGGASTHTFQVDLRGLVDLLSHHLYSSPRVYVRELLQNAVDAVTARRRSDAAAPAWVRITADGGRLVVEDPGVGLTEADVHTFLATIGRSSKRDRIAGVEAARREFLGQFGIGLLACFTVADDLRVVTRSAGDAASAPVEWHATSDGSYTVRVLDAGSAEAARVGPGTTVTLTPRPGCESWFEPGRVVELARDYGSLLPYPVTVRHAGVDEVVTDTPAVWDRTHATPGQRREALLDHGERVLGFAPLDVIDLDVPVAGLRGAAYVLPHAAGPGDTGRHRVHLKGMLLADAATGLMPEWAFFVRCVVDADGLQPTASREALYEDDTLAAVREALGGRVRAWLAELAAGDPARLARFLGVHELGVKALARTDDELLRLMLPWLRFESAEGAVNLADYVRAHPVVHVAATVEEFRQVAPIAAAQGLGLVNGGYTYDAEVLARLPRVVPGVQVTDLDADVVLASLDPVHPDDELALAGLLALARARLDHLDCDVVVRAFHPVSLAALHLDGRAARGERARARAESEADGLWAQILGSLRSDVPRAQLVLNHHHPVLGRLAALTEPELVGTAVEALYGQALLMTHRPLRPADSALMNRTFGDLLAWAARRPAGGDR